MNRLLLGAGLAVALVLGGCGGCGTVEPIPDGGGVTAEVSASASTVAVSPETLPADGASAATVTVTVRDADGTALPGVSVALAASGTGNTISGSPADTNAEGVATFTVTSTKAEEKQLTATAGETALDAKPTVTFVPSDAARLAVRVQPSNVQSGVAISPAVVIDVVDAQGNLVEAGAPVITVALGEGPEGATLSGATTVTAAEGEASFTDLRIDRVGAGYTLVFSAPGLEPVETETFEVLAGPPARLAFVSQPPNGAAGVALPSAIELELQDSQGNAVEGTASVSLAIASGPAGATISGTTTVQTTDGRVRFEDVVLNRAGSYTLAATAQGFMGATSMSFTISAGEAAQLGFNNQPDPVNVRDAFTVSVSVRDASGNRVMSASNAVTVSLMGTGSGALLGTATVNAVSGIATFNNLSVDDEGTYTLRATSGTLTDATSVSFEVTDDIAPDAVTNFAVTQVGQTQLTLGWTASGDDGVLGNADAYELRWSLIPVTEANFATAMQVTTGTPAAPGAQDFATVTGLPAATQVFFGLRVTDGAGNQSPIAFVSGTTSACPTGYAGASCDVCATGFRETAPGVCQDYCTNPDPCNPPPANSCSGDVLSSYGATRTCSPTMTAPFFTCQAPTTTNCAASGQLCHSGACVANPCSSTTCTPPAATCNAQGERVTWASACTVDRTGTAPAAVCNDTPTVTACASGTACSNGACVPVTAATAGALVITEIHHSPSAGTTQWFEILNASAAIIDLRGLTFETAGTGGASFTVGGTAAVLLQPGALFVFAQNGDTASNGGVTAQFAWGAQTTAMNLGANRHLRILDGTTVVDEVDYSAPGFPNTSGQAMNLSSGALSASANANPWYWCNATAAMSGGDLGTPGAANGDCALTVTAPVDFCRVQFPTNGGTVLGDAGLQVFGRIYEPQVTDRNQSGNDGYPWLQMQLGHGLAPQSGLPDPAAWTWTAAGYNAGYNSSSPGFNANDDELVGSLAPAQSGQYLYGFRVRLVDPATGTPGAWTYCDTAGVANAPETGTWGTVTVQNPAADIAAARATANGTGLSLRVEGALVTAVKPNLGSNDPAGFFVQGSQTGPALFIRVDPASLTPDSPVAGDRVSFTVTELGTTAGLKQAQAITAYARLSTGNSLTGWSQEVSSATNLISGLAGYESELLAFTATISNAFASGGAPFVSAQITTAGQTANTDLRLRVLDTVRDALELGVGCTVTVTGVPMWRFNAQAQPLIWEASRFVDVTGCPAPRVLSATAIDATTVEVNFDRILDASSVAANGSQFAISPALNVTAAAVTGPRQVTLTTAAQGDAVAYTVTVASTVLDQHGTPVAAPDDDASFTGFSTTGPVCVTPSVVISQVFGGGAASAAFSHDYVELFNRGSTPVDLAGWSIQYGSATGTGNWGKSDLTGTIPPGGFFLIGRATSGSTGNLPTPDATMSMDMGGSAGKVALVSTTTVLNGACPTGTIVDVVGYGSNANCYSGSTRAPSPSATNSITRVNNGCQDNNENGANFAPVPANPRNSATATAACVCQ